jgi:hypothetical protein
VSRKRLLFGMNFKIVALCGIIFASISMCQVCHAADAFTVTGSTVSTNPVLNSKVKLKADFVSRTNVSDVIVDLEVYTLAKERVHQEFFENEHFSLGKTNSYETVWTPNKSGTYIFKVGIFESNWGKTIFWNRQVLIITPKDPGKVAEAK